MFLPGIVDGGNDFYAPWLGETMAYTAAIWPDDRRDKRTLAEAQLTKVDWHLDSAGLAPGSGGRVMDVGCGWGGLLERAVDTGRAREGVGVTIAEEQAAWIREHYADKPVHAVVSRWEDYQADEPFDGIVSIGAFEHFARPELNRAAKIEQYGRFFRFAAESLRPGGRLSLQTIVWMNVAPQDEVGNLPLHIFPESNLPHVPEVMEAAAPYFHVMRFHNRPGDYSRTLRVWIRGLGEHRAALGELTSPAIVKRYRDGFAGFVLGFESGVIGLTRWSMVKR